MPRKSRHRAGSRKRRRKGDELKADELKAPEDDEQDEKQQGQGKDELEAVTVGKLLYDTPDDKDDNVPTANADGNANEEQKVGAATCFRRCSTTISRNLRPRLYGH